MKVKQFRYSSDNLGYIVYGKSSAIAIDGGAVHEILDFIKINGLHLHYVLNTHNHMDHTVGNKALLSRSKAQFMDNKSLIKNKTLQLDGEQIHVYHTPGHTLDSISFHLGDVLITGDTLFQGKVGRCFSDDLKAFFTSVKTIMGFPEQTIIYAGHDYVEEYMDFAKRLEADNPSIDEYLKKYDPSHVRSTLADEYQVNPFLRFNQEKIISILREKGLPVETEYDRWESMLSLM
jgi:hydroxyacylglutathione hydrolase